AVRGLGAKRVILGGHSYGGRPSSMLIAGDAQAADALLCLSYPLHPPHQPGKLRTEHFSSITVPCLFVHGGRGPFGSIDEMKAALKKIPSKPRLIPVEKAAHDLKQLKVEEILPELRALLP